MVRKYTKVLLFYHIRNMTLTMYYSGSRNSVSQYATSGPQDLSSQRCPNIKGKPLTHFTTEFSNCHDSVNFQTQMNA